MKTRRAIAVYSVVAAALLVLVFLVITRNGETLSTSVDPIHPPPAADPGAGASDSHVRSIPPPSPAPDPSRSMSEPEPVSEEVFEEDTDAETAASDRPLFVVESEGESSLEAQIYDFTQQTVHEGGPEAESIGRRLLGAEDPLLRSSGGMILVALGSMDADALNAVVRDEDPAVRLNVLGALSDAGMDAEAGYLLESIDLSVDDAGGVSVLLETPGTLEAGRRAVLDASRGLLPGEAGTEIYTGLANSPGEAYSVRMKSALLLRETLPFEAYREQIGELRLRASDAAWAEGLGRLAEQLEGPVEVHQELPALSIDAVDERLARPYAGMFEDLALYMEFVLGLDAPTIEPGLASVLTEYLEEFSEQPWSEEEEISLGRLRALSARLPADTGL